MNTYLYLHGLNSTNKNDRTDWLEQFGKVVNPLMEYRNYPKNFKYLEKLVLQYRPRVIIGSSLGGFFAFHLGNYYNIPTILLNPALLVTNITKPDNRAYATAALHTISIGTDDQIIPPFTTFAVLEQLKAKYQAYSFSIGHETPFDVFVNICQKSGLFTY